MSALEKYGELYRNEEGHEVWRIRGNQNNIIEDNISSDFDAEWLAERTADIGE